VTNERLTGPRTPEEDGLIVYGIDPASLGAWPDFADREIRDPALPPDVIPRVEERPDGTDLDALIDKYLAYEEDRYVIRFALRGKGPAEISAAFDAIGWPCPKGTIKERLNKSVAVLSAAYKLECVDREIRVSALTEKQHAIWRYYRAGETYRGIAEALGCGTRFAFEQMATITENLRAAGYGEIVDAVDALRKAMAPGGRGNISRISPDGGHDGATSDSGTVPAAS